MNSVQDNFSKAHLSYDQHSSIQKLMAEELYGIFKGKFQPGRVMEYGVGTGHLSQFLAQDTNCLELDFVDFSLSMLFQCQMNVMKVGTKARTHFIEANIEQHNLPTCASAYISNATIQWLEDFPAFLKKSFEKLDSGSIMAFSAFGDQHFFEFYESAKNSLEFDPRNRTKVNFYSQTQLENLATEVGFEIVHFQEQMKVERFLDFRSLLKHLKNMGVRDDASAFNLTPKTFKKWEKNYIEIFQSENEIPLSWHYFLILLQKP